MSGFDHADPFQQPTNEHTPPALHSGGGSRRQLALAKEGHRYVFDYEPGQETELLERLVNLAQDPDCALGMFDAAVLCHQVGMGLSQQVGEMLKG